MIQLRLRADTRHGHSLGGPPRADLDETKLRQEGNRLRSIRPRTKDVTRQIRKVASRLEALERRSLIKDGRL